MVKKIDAYECCKCNKAHSTIQRAKNCEAKHRREKQKAKAENISKKDRDKIINGIRNGAETYDEIFTKIAEFIAKYYSQEIKFENNKSLRFGETSNSHDKPIGAEYNWNRNKDFPTCYPGWCGYLKGNLPKNDNFYFGNMVEGSFSPEHNIPQIRGIHLGTGGWGNSFGGNARIFIDDFPILLAKYHELVAIAKEWQVWSEARMIAANKFRNFVDKTIADDKILKEIDIEMSKLNVQRFERVDSLEVECRDSHSKFFEKADALDTYDKERMSQLSEDLNISALDEIIELEQFLLENQLPQEKK